MRRSALLRNVRGVIRSRLLVNAIVDPDEAAARLPHGLRPHIVGNGTVVGCCLLDIEAIRPVPLPGVIGMRLRAAAHRISVEWDDPSGDTTVGVYVPTRLTDSRLARAIGGRAFPGVHRRATVDVNDAGAHVAWSVAPGRALEEFAVRVRASAHAAATEPCEAIGGTCIAALVGVSPNHRGVLEAARMEPAHRRAHLVDVDDLDSRFLDSFVSARPAQSYLMRDVDVTWTPAAAPRRTAVLIGVGR